MRGVSGFLAELGFCWFGGSAVLATRRSGGLGADEVEGAALVGGGFGEHGDVGVGVVVADLVAGQGGQVIEQAAEAAQWGAVWAASRIPDCGFRVLLRGEL